MSTFKHEGHQLVVGRTADDEVFALDNRCPHEGYPLAQGDLKGCALTCCWHNWKFDVRDGSCTIGGEGVRHYPTRVSDGQLQVDLTPPNPAEAIADLRTSFFEGLHKGEVGRALRDAARQLQLDRPARAILWDIALQDARYAEYGSSHVLAVAAEAARILPRHVGSDALYAIAPALDLCADSNRYMPERAVPKSIASDSGSVEDDIVAAIESEELAQAEGLFRGVVDSGASLEGLDHLLLRCASLHLTGFGHELIYLSKIREFMDGAPVDIVREVYAALLFSIGIGTRQDTLPFMKPYTSRFAKVEDELASFAASARDDAEFDAASVRDAVLDGNAEAAVQAVTGALRSGVSTARVARAVVAAAAHRLWRFDIAVDRDPMVAETWLWVTHRFTFSSAVRIASERWGGVEAIRLLFQSVAFVHSGHSMDRASEDRKLPDAEALGLSGLMTALASKDEDRAQAAILHMVRAEEDLQPAREAIEELALSDPMVRPIFVAHVWKTPIAAFDEVSSLPIEDAEVALAGAMRFLATPIAERRVRETVGTTLRWVVDGQMPRKLTQ
ncbi:MAG: nitrite reductase/ring-hydroxylating ferredoxin subunit [Planctomycetota bacterium]|jgi:nitrite reductase/ring-hydroxylating ferredoxin subunit